VTLVLLSNDPGAWGNRIWEWRKMAHVWPIFGQGDASLCEASTELKNLSRVQSREFPGSESKAGRFRRRFEASDEDPAMRRSLLAMRGSLRPPHRMTALRRFSFSRLTFSPRWRRRLPRLKGGGDLGQLLLGVLYVGRLSSKPSNSSGYGWRLPG